MLITTLQHVSERITKALSAKTLISTSGAIISTVILALGSQKSLATNEVCAPKSDQNFIDSCWYLGVGAGISDITVKDDNEWQTTGSEDTAGYFAIGNRFKPNWFVELRLSDLGEADVDPKDSSDPRTDAVAYSMTDISVGYMLFGTPERIFNAYTKAGVGFLATDVENSEINILEEVTGEISLGLGLQARFANRYFARLEVNTYGEDIQAAFFSINRYFGKTEGERNNF